MIAIKAVRLTELLRLAEAFFLETVTILCRYAMNAQRYTQDTFQKIWLPV